MCKTPKWIFTYSNGLVCCFKNRNPIALIFRKIIILIPNWVMGRTAALDVSVTSPLNPQTLLEAATAAALTTEERKHDENDPKCSELGWVCIPVVAESYGAWGREATLLFSTIASRIATLSNKPKSVTLIDIYGHLNLQLVRANATSILARLMPPSY